MVLSHFILKRTNTHVRLKHCVVRLVIGSIKR